MSDRPRIAPNVDKPLIDKADMSVTITGPVTTIQGPTMLSYDISWTGTPTGAFEVQVSNTYRQSPTGEALNAGNWTTIPTAAFQGNYPTPAGSDGNGFIEIILTAAQFVRLVYEPDSGAGSLTVVPSGKVS